MLFLSADIVGSTALKQSAGLAATGSDPAIFGPKPELPNPGIRPLLEGEIWFSVIQGFYIKATQEFSRFFNSRRAFLRSNDLRDKKFGETPILWKTIGDEILFRKRIDDHAQIGNTIVCWIAAMSEVRTFLRSKNPRLDIKCTAWLAEFPVQNKLIIGPSGNHAAELDSDDMQTVGDFIGQYESNFAQFPDTRIDFVGPAIDVGFRLTALATSRKFIISLDVARFLAELDIADLKIFYDGRTYLKGVANGVEYPVFWIDMSTHDGIDKAEDSLQASEAPSSTKIKRFCEAFYKDKGNPTYPPFIISDSEVDFREPPDDYYIPYNIIADRYTSDDLRSCPI